MELVGLAKELLQRGAEVAVSYRVGQAVLRYADRALWVLEKSARWAVPPACEYVLSSDNTLASLLEWTVEAEETTPPPPELVRPLPWPLFLALLVVLRAARESASLFNLLLGKPPLRPADVVMFLQSKRRYLRALKYQGNRNMRARANRPQGAPSNQWLSSFYSLLEMTMCFRRPLEQAGNNNTSLASNNDDEILVVRKSKKRGDKGTRLSHASPPPDENTMERLIEKMVDMYGESSDDSEYTLTNATSIKSDTSITSDEEESALENTLTDAGDSHAASSTPNKSGSAAAAVPPSDCSQIQDSLLGAPEKQPTDDGAEEQDSLLNAHTDSTLAREDDDPLNAQIDSPKKASETLIDSEKRPEETPKKATKLANGRTPKSSPGSKKGSPKRGDSDMPTVKITPADDTNNTNGNVEGAYSQNDCGAVPVQGHGVDVKKTVPSKGTGKSQSKAKESKIKAPLWKKPK